jgi:hypothetical protein
MRNAPMRSANASPGVRDKNALPHLIIFREKQLQLVLNQYVVYFNRARPHQGIQQQVPEPSRIVSLFLSDGQGRDKRPTR